MKKISAILLVIALMLSLTGCVANRNAMSVDEDEIDRPTVVVLNGETELSATVPSVDAETGADNTKIVKNAVAAGDTLTLTGKHASGITTITYRFISGEGETEEKGEVTVAKAKTLDVAIPTGTSALELYVTNGNGIVSKWATYYFG